MSQGGKREGAGRKASTPTATHPVRCTDEGWEWLQSQASGKGHSSVGKWADSKGRNHDQTFMSDPSPSNCSPVRVTLSRRKGWRMPPNTIKVCRPGMWGNPFTVDGERTTEQAVIMYEAWLGGADWDSWLWSKHRKHWLRTLNAESRLHALLDELRGKNLACWCWQKTPCHAAVLLRLANAGAVAADGPK